MVKYMLEFYKNKKVLITGHTGFKGSWLALWLNKAGANVCGYALAPQTEPSLFDILNLNSKIKSVIADINDQDALSNTFEEFKPEIVFHLAAQPLVRKSYMEPVLTYKTNVMGTLNVLEAARISGSVKAFVNVTTDKCYENIEQNCCYKESDRLGGYDMYSSSKACVEILSSSYRRSFLDNGQTAAFQMATARAGNVIGGGDWACDRLVPDFIRSIESGNPISLRHPEAIRPWQFVLEPLWGYLILAEKLYNSSDDFTGAYNFGPEADNVLSVLQVVDLMISTFGKGSITIENPDEKMHEAGILRLDISKSKNKLLWKPVYTAKQAVKKTVEWYKNYYDGVNMVDYSLNQLNSFEEDWNGKNS